jgi:hypothetical protein
VIAGNHELREREAVEKRPRGRKLPSLCPLRQVSRHGDEMRGHTKNCFGERTDRCQIDAPEVNVGKVDNDSHI